MRVKAKEIRRRRHRKEQKIKDALRVIRAEQGERKANSPAKPKPSAKKPAARPSR